MLTVGDDPASLADLEAPLSREEFEATSFLYAGEDPRVAVCEWLRAANPEPTIIIMADRASQDDEIWGLDAGADDYIIKPFSPEVLAARIKASVRGRRDAAGKQQVIEAGDLYIDVRNYVLRVKDEPIDLRSQEFRILAILAQSSGEPLNREELIWRTPGQWQGNPNRTVIIHSHRLRSAIETLSDYTYIHTVRKDGYRFEPVPKKRASARHSNNGRTPRQTLRIRRHEGHLDPIDPCGALKTPVHRGVPLAALGEHRVQPSVTRATSRCCYHH